MELYTKKETINDKQYKIKIWDTAGQEQYRSLTRNFFHSAEGILLIYDITNLDSFEKVKTWINCIQDNASENIKVVLIGSKCDLEKSRAVSTEDGKQLASHLKLQFYETSSLTNHNIREAVLDLTNQIIHNKIEIAEKIKLQHIHDEEDEHKQGCRC